MNEELSKLIEEAHAIKQEAQEVFGPLDSEQLNWKPSAEAWSVAQCFDHLIDHHHLAGHELHDLQLVGCLQDSGRT